ncbi:SCO family protein [Aliifodinibius sp. S!AR15-10]|uniref:SCO family protein n=1 Tax=Aliifodinibius sp. S!AR15-10 TaxID=2950437 RepID=UPI002855371B|nr:SCO family protein [Aliifodinibius sp. S!AR15-10]MDR8393212.1 SCO family protein [Aliifodinibius sp. S!AR15-10]
MKWQKVNNRIFISATQFLLVGCLLLLPAASFAQLNNKKPANVQNVEIVEHLGDTIPLDLKFATSAGDSVTIRQLMKNDKPVILNPVYYHCPMLCSMVTDAIYSGIQDIKWNLGNEFEIITFSFDPNEHPQLADSTKQVYIDRLGKDKVGDGWHFLTGRQQAIEKLTNAVGFQYEKVERNGQYAHSAAIIFLSPKGTITRYLYGIKFNEFQVRNGLYDAADGEIGSTVDKIVMYCYQYDPSSNSYVPVAWRIMQLGGLATFLILGIFLGLLWLKEKGSNNDRKLND